LRFKRIAAFLAILVAGLWLLELARGDEDLFPTHKPTTEAATGPREPHAPGTGAAQPLAAVSGAITYRPHQEVTGPDGNIHLLEQFRVACADSQPLAGNSQEMRDVETAFFDWSFDADGKPARTEVARMTCSRMLVGLVDGPSPQIDKHREMQMHDVRLVSSQTAGSGVGELRAAQLQSKLDRDRLRLWTVGAFDPFTLLLDNGRYQVTGEGLEAIVQTTKGPGPGMAFTIARAARLRDLELPADAQPLMACEGELSYRGSGGETGSGVLRMTGGVRAVLRATDGNLLVGEGRDLEVWLRRRGDRELLPQGGQLLGTPGRLVLGTTELSGGRIQFACNAAGDLARLLVDQSARLTIPGDRLGTPEAVTLAAATAIEVSLLEALTKNDLAHFGMPAAAAQVPTHWIQFLGQTNTASPSPPARGAAGLELRAADGLLVATDSQGNNLWMRADGEAEIRLDRGHLDGNRGFLLHHSTGGRLALRMPAVPVADPAHRYRATFGATRLAGAGSFLFEQPPDGRIHVQLRDPDSGQPTPGTVVVDFASERAAERTHSGDHAHDVWLEAGELKRL
jgi:hypothetical protein